MYRIISTTGLDDVEEQYYIYRKKERKKKNSIIIFLFYTPKSSRFFVWPGKMYKIKSKMTGG